MEVYIVVVNRKLQLFTTSFDRYTALFKWREAKDKPERINSLKVVRFKAV